MNVQKKCIVEKVTEMNYLKKKKHFRYQLIIEREKVRPSWGWISFGSWNNQKQTNDMPLKYPIAIDIVEFFFLRFVVFFSVYKIAVNKKIFIKKYITNRKHALIWLHCKLYDHINDTMRCAKE